MADNSKLTKILLVGDIHGNEQHAEWVLRTAAREGATHVIAAGDFGYWAHLSWGRRFLANVAGLANSLGITLWWVDGNHENHDMLEDLVAEHGDEHPIAIEAGNLWWIPRGATVEIAGLTIMGFGGAYSVDWDMRTPGHSWWAGELITREQVDRLAERREADPRPVDILVTHEAPLGKKLTYKDRIPESVAQRALVSEIHALVKPALHVTGHHHVRETFGIDDAEVHVVGRDGMDDESVLVVEVENGRIVTVDGVPFGSSGAAA